ncbi:MAG: plasmid pRiA4b ORF-3 family protein [Terriglobales bacterium]
MAGKKNRVLYQLKVTLRDIDPPIWRRIQVWDDTTLAQLHRILQIAIGWENYHLHEFHIGRRVYGVPDPDDDRPIIDDRRYRLRAVVPQVGTSFEYVYDFGDNWRHELLLEAVVLPESEQQYPRCVAGERSGPPEDVGGPFGYAGYLEALTDSHHEEHEAMLEWHGPFHSESFSLAAVNQRLRRKSR